VEFFLLEKGEFNSLWKLLQHETHELARLTSWIWWDL